MFYTLTAKVFRGSSEKYFVFINPNNFNVIIYNITTLKKVNEIDSISKFIQTTQDNWSLPIYNWEIHGITPFYLDDSTFCFNIKYIKKGGKRSDTKKNNCVTLEMNLQTGNIVHVNQMMLNMQVKLPVFRVNHTTNLDIFFDNENYSVKYEFGRVNLSKETDDFENSLSFKSKEANLLDNLNFKCSQDKSRITAFNNSVVVSLSVDWKSQTILITSIHLLNS